LSQQSELQPLLQTAAEFVQPLLQEFGEFYPFAVVLDDGGHREILRVLPAEETRSRKVVYAELVAALRRRAATYRGIALCYDGLIALAPGQDKVDAVMVRLEHQSGLSMLQALPYVRAVDGSVTFGMTRGGKVPPEILFAH
jgi:hypothetical protein